MKWVSGEVFETNHADTCKSLVLNGWRERCGLGDRPETHAVNCSLGVCYLGDLGVGRMYTDSSSIYPDLQKAF